MIRMSPSGLSAVILLTIFIFVSAHFISSGKSTTEYVDSYASHVKIPSRTGSGLTKGSGSSLQKHAIAAASNATLGFHKIYSIQLEHRYDKRDATQLQAYTSGTKVEFFKAVDGKKDIQDTGRIGMPPGAAPLERLGPGTLGCFRSHANVWSELVEQRLPPVLILESDSYWDINLRPIMGLANKHFVEYLKEVGSQAPASPFYTADVPANSQVPAQFDASDPWQSEHWDILSFGHCGDQGAFGGQPPRTYFDPLNGENKDYTIPEGSNRLIRRADSFICTTAYAVSHRGAAKLMLRTARELQEPIDWIIGGAIKAGELIAYTVNPPMFTQWEYVHGLGQGLGVTSDIHRHDGSGDATAEVDNSGWEKVRKEKTSWRNKGPLEPFKAPALSKAFERLVTQNTQFVMPDIPGV